MKGLASTIYNNYKSPIWWRNSVLIPNFVRPVHSIYNQNLGISVVDEDWDNLLILDACRADLFEEVADTDEFSEYRTVYSKGSATPEWLHENFSGKEHGDIVYVSSNPFVSKEISDKFHKVISVWEDDFDQEIGTVHPNIVVKATKNVIKEYPNKRIISHFVQPHHPFVNQDAAQISHDWINDISENKDTPKGPSDPWQALETGKVSKSDIWELYVDNLRYVLQPAMDLASDLGGKSVITSDHGNMLGERAWPVPLRIYGHPSGIKSPKLIKVPWAVLQGDTRRRIIEGGTSQSSTSNQDIINNRLENLGYK